MAFPLFLLPLVNWILYGVLFVLIKRIVIGLLQATTRTLARRAVLAARRMRRRKDSRFSRERKMSPAERLKAERDAARREAVDEVKEQTESMAEEIASTIVGSSKVVEIAKKIALDIARSSPGGITAGGIRGAVNRAIKDEIKGIRDEKIEAAKGLISVGVVFLTAKVLSDYWGDIESEIMKGLPWNVLDLMYQANIIRVYDAPAPGYEDDFPESFIGEAEFDIPAGLALSIMSEWLGIETDWEGMIEDTVIGITTEAARMAKENVRDSKGYITHKRKTELNRRESKMTVRFRKPRNRKSRRVYNKFLRKFSRNLRKDLVEAVKGEDAKKKRRRRRRGGSGRKARINDAARKGIPRRTGNLREGFYFTPPATQGRKVTTVYGVRGVLYARWVPALGDWLAYSRNIVRKHERKLASDVRAQNLRVRSEIQARVNAEKKRAAQKKYKAEEERRRNSGVRGALKRASGAVKSGITSTVRASIRIYDSISLQNLLDKLFPD